MQARLQKTATSPPACITVHDLLPPRFLRTQVAFAGGPAVGLLSKPEIDVAMNMLRPGQTVTLEDQDGGGGCAWSLSRSFRDEFSASCTGSQPPTVGARAVFSGVGMTVKCPGLHPDTLRTLEYMNAQLLPRAEVCREAGELMRNGVLSARNAEKQRPASTGWSGVQRAGMPSIFAANNGGIVSLATDLVNAEAPRGCHATHVSVGRRLYLASLLCATASQTQQPFLIVDTASRAVPMPPDVARNLYRTPVLGTHVSVLVEGPAGSQRLNCYARLIRNRSTGGESLKALVGTLGMDVIGDFLLIAGPMTNNFGVVFRPSTCKKYMKAQDALVSDGLLRVHQ